MSFSFINLQHGGSSRYVYKYNLFCRSFRFALLNESLNWPWNWPKKYENLVSLFWPSRDAALDPAFNVSVDQITSFINPHISNTVFISNASSIPIINTLMRPHRHLVMRVTELSLSTSQNLEARNTGSCHNWIDEGRRRCRIVLFNIGLSIDVWSALVRLTVPWIPLGLLDLLYSSDTSP